LLLVVEGTPGTLAVASFTVSTSTISVDQTVTFTVGVVGGTLPYYYRYSDLPDGCTGTNASTLTCAPSSPGAFNISVAVVDSSSQQAIASVELTVLPSSPGSTSIGGASPFEWALLGGALVAAGAIGVWLVRRRNPG
jgi:hypothetical protein